MGALSVMLTIRHRCTFSLSHLTYGLSNAGFRFGINLDADRGHDLRVQPVTGKRTVEQFSIHFERSNHLSAPLDSGTLASNKLLLRDLT
jgi:hypothetical protein